MNSYTDTIILTINEVEFEAIVKYDFYKGEPRITTLLPEDCQEGSADEYCINSLWVVVEHYEGSTQEDISFLIDDLEIDIIKQLVVIRGDNLDR